jgi:hypothetical protein
MGKESTTVFSCMFIEEGLSYPGLSAFKASWIDWIYCSLLLVFEAFTEELDVGWGMRNVQQGPAHSDSSLTAPTSNRSVIDVGNG